jgi:hypothetical protein
MALDDVSAVAIVDCMHDDDPPGEHYVGPIEHRAGEFLVTAVTKGEPALVCEPEEKPLTGRRQVRDECQKSWVWLKTNKPGNRHMRRTEGALRKRVLRNAAFNQARKERQKAMREEKAQLRQRRLEVKFLDMCWADVGGRLPRDTRQNRRVAKALIRWAEAIAKR